MNTCALCGKPIADEDLVTLQVQEARQTHWSPAEYVDVTLHQACADEPERDPAYERAAANFDDSDGQKDWR